MRHATTFARAQSNWDNMLPPDNDGPEPSLNHLSEAFDLLVADVNLMAEFCEEEGPDVTTIFQLMHARGLPKMDKSERDDELRDRYKATSTDFFVAYRDWLGDRLTDKAEEVMQTEIQAARDDAEDYAADCRDHHREFGRNFG